MNSMQNVKKFVVTPPAAIYDNASLTCNVIDTAGYDAVAIDLVLGATDIAMTTLKVQESDTKSSATALTSGADVTGLVYGTSNNIAGSASALPTADDDNKVFRFEIDCRYRKRYLLLVATCGNGAAGTYAMAIADLHRAAISDTSASDRGCGDILRV